MKDQITFTTDPKVFLESGQEVVYLERIDSGMLVHFPQCFLAAQTKKLL
ncbi:MAG: hypothetical protein PHW76_05765 [Alphaproteobacteria bacterium]|nr:hypothetical protein [Alphaproteobacteria bacterium]